MDKMRIAWLFPDILYLHGERGNILALEHFARLAGLEVEVEKVEFNTKNFDPMNYNIIFCPPGELSSFQEILRWLKPYEMQFEQFISQGRPLIVTGTSVALWGETIERTDGESFNGMNMRPVSSLEKKDVYGDDIYFTCRYNDKTFEIIGNQIQMIDVCIGDENPFGCLIYGYGNTGTDRTEGVIYKNSIFTNTLGPMLVLNPELTAEIIKVACNESGLEYKEIVFVSSLEKKSFETKKEFIMTKESHLVDCKSREAKHGNIRQTF